MKKDRVPDVGLPVASNCTFDIVWSVIFVTEYT